MDSLAQPMSQCLRFCKVILEESRVFEEKNKPLLEEGKKTTIGTRITNTLSPR